MFEIYSMFTIKTPEQRHWRGSYVFVVDFEQVLHIARMFIVHCSVVNFEQLNARWSFSNLALWNCC